jgi:DNA polymerase-4
MATEKTFRKIIHVDMDAFFASVEQRDHPALRGKPIAVGHAGARGVVATASYEARKFGVHSAMPSSKARELCPQLIFVHSRMRHYQAVSRQVRAIFERYTDIIEPVSIDEAFLDVTENKIGAATGLEIAQNIKKDIRVELGLIASAGVSYNKFLAKIASDYRKPDGLCVIHPSLALEFIDRLPIEAFWGIGPATAKRLHALGIDSAPKLREMSLARLTELFGKAGLTYYNFVRGIDDRDVVTHRERKSVGCEETFGRDIRGQAIHEALKEVIEELVRRVTRRQFKGKRLTLKVRFPDFTTVTRSTSGTQYLDNANTITELAHRLMDNVTLPSTGIRLLGLTVSKTDQEVKDEYLVQQMRLFE